MKKKPFIECKKTKICMFAHFWPGTSAGIFIWNARKITKCRFADYDNEWCILREEVLRKPMTENKRVHWRYGGAGCESGSNYEDCLFKTWKNPYSYYQLRKAILFRKF